MADKGRSIFHEHIEVKLGVYQGVLCARGGVGGGSWERSNRGWGRVMIGGLVYSCPRRARGRGPGGSENPRALRGSLGSDSARPGDQGRRDTWVGSVVATRSPFLEARAETFSLASDFARCFAEATASVRQGGIVGGGGRNGREKISETARGRGGVGRVCGVGRCGRPQGRGRG